MSLRVVFLALLIPLAAGATHPIGERLDALINAPLSADPVLDNKLLNDVLVAAVSVENIRKTREDSQLFYVVNASNHNICFGTVSAVGSTCNDALCDTDSAWTSQGYQAKMNCTRHDPSEGRLVLPMQSRIFRYDGTRCACVVASTTNVSAQVERIVR